MSTGQKITVYGLVSSKEPNRVRYVGQTKLSTGRRLALHKYQSKNTTSHTPVGKWIQSQIKKGFEIKIVTLVSAGVWDKTEQETIEVYRQKDILLNLTDGGCGHTGSSMSDETKAKMRAASLGKPKSRDHAQNISRGKKGWSPSIETRQKMSEAFTGRQMSERNKKELSQRMLGNKFASGRVWTPEMRKKKSDEARQQWQTGRFGKGVN